MSETVNYPDNKGCPGCQDCGDKCDAWTGQHLWVSYHTAIDINDVYFLCDFCWERRESE